MRAFAGLLMAALLFVSCAAFLGNDREAGIRYLQLARREARSGRTGQAARLYRLATQRYRRLAEAYYELAELLLSRNTVNDRVQAAECLTEAVRYAPDSVKYRMALARLNMQRRLTLSARNGFKKVLELDSSNAEAHFFLGFLHEQDFLHFQNMVDGDSGGARIHFTEFADKEYRQSVRHYRKALELKPTYLKPGFRLAFLYYEKANWPAMIHVLRRCVRAVPDSKEAHLYLALAYHRAQQYKQAWHEFRTALRLMKPRERRFYCSYELLSPAPKDSLLFASAEDPLAAEKDPYWLQRDPLYLTEFNERLMEHWARIAYADLRFGDPLRGVPGWKTDRGKVYIRYGPPLKKVRTRPWIGVRSGPGRSPLVTSKETWSYPDFDFVFEDRFLTGRFEFKWGFTPYDDYLDIYKRMIKKLPELYYPNWGGGLFRVPVQVVRFRSKAGTPVLYVFSGVPVKAVDRLFFRRENRATTVLDHGVFLFDRNWKTVFSRKGRVYLETYLNPRLSQNYFLATDSLRLAPGRYHLAVEYMDPKGKHVGRFRDVLRLAAFPGDSLALSDLLLASEIRLKTDLARLNRSRMLVYPNFSGTYRVGQELFLYYEIYNLSLNTDGKSRFRTTLVVQPVQGKNPLRALLALLPGVDFSLPQVAVSSAMEGSRSQENQFRILQLRGYRPGNYRLTVRVQDQHSGQSAQRSVDFRIVE